MPHTTTSTPYTLRDALAGGPGLHGYAYQADTFCIDCGRAIIRALDAAQGSAAWDELDFRDSAVLPQPMFFEPLDRCSACLADSLTRSPAGPFDVYTSTSAREAS